MLASPKLKTVQCISKLSTMSFAFLGPCSSACILMLLPIHPCDVLNFGMLRMGGGAFLLYSIVVSVAESQLIPRLTFWDLSLRQSSDHFH